VFDPFLSSRPLAQALMQAPEGQLIAEGHYYEFSSVFFYTNRRGLLLDTPRVNLEYGSNAPGAPQVFVDDSRWKDLWLTPERYYLIASESSLPRLESLVGPGRLDVVVASGGKLLLTNHSLEASVLPRSPGQE